MTFPIWIRPALFGAVVGAVALAIIGFSWGGWVTAGSAQTIAANKSASAVAQALLPYCLERSRTDPQAQAVLVSLKAASSYSRSDILAKAGWATPLGMDESNSQLAQACQLKLAESF